MLAYLLMRTKSLRRWDKGYIAFIEELPGANTQGATLEEARENLREAAELVLEANRALAEQPMEGTAIIHETFERSSDRF
jgi:predicted RNase H-like HicB family nuclease